MQPSKPPPWRIGWFGALRDRKGFALLEALARRLPGKVEIILRGIPSEKEFPDLVPGEIAPGLRYEGPYRYDRDLPSIYGDVHFAWAIDYFEEGLNSTWLLPNRLYESLLYGSVPIALAHVEVGRRLQAYAAGITLESTDPFEELVDLLTGMTPDKYNTLKQAALRLPRVELMAGQNDSLELIAALSRLPPKR